MSSSYLSRLTPDLFEVLNAFLPSVKPGGRPRSTDLLDVMNAIFYVLAESVQWRALPHDFLAWQTVYTDFRNWKRDGTWLKIHDALLPKRWVVERTFGWLMNDCRLVRAYE